MARIIDREVYEARLAAGLVCPDHPAYKGLRKPRKDCVRCWAIYQTRIDLNVKERRVRENGRTEKHADGLTTVGLADNQVHIVGARVTENKNLDSVYGLITEKLTARNYETHVIGEAQWSPTTHPGETYAEKREREGRE
jgi:hypothetical protein